MHELTVVRLAAQLTKLFPRNVKQHYHWIIKIWNIYEDYFARKFTTYVYFARLAL